MTIGHLPENWSCRDLDIEHINWITRFYPLTHFSHFILRETWNMSAAQWSPTPPFHCKWRYVQYIVLKYQSFYTTFVFFHFNIAFNSFTDTKIVREDLCWTSWSGCSWANMEIDFEFFVFWEKMEKYEAQAFKVLSAWSSVLLCFARMRPSVIVRACENKG